MRQEIGSGQIKKAMMRILNVPLPKDSPKKLRKSLNSSSERCLFCNESATDKSLLSTVSKSNRKGTKICAVGEAAREWSHTNILSKIGGAH